MIKRFIAKQLYNLGVKSRKKTKKGLVLLATTFLNGYNNASYDSNKNGESYILNIMSKFKPKIIFDVGANIGEWSDISSKLYTDATTYSFELAESTFKILEENTKNMKNVKTFNVGLSDKKESVEYLFYGAGAGNTTLVMNEDIHSKVNCKTLVGHTLTGDDFCRENNINKIDFLKVDVEGAEPNVFKGFQDMIKNHKIDVIQFEYGMVNIYTRYLLKDYYEFFKENGYEIGKLHPNGVKFNSYKPQDEDFKGPNYIAVLKENKEYIRELSDH